MRTEHGTTFYLDRSPVSDYLSLLDALPDDEFRNLTRSTVPLLDDWRQPSHRLASLEENTNTDLTSASLHFEYSVPSIGRARASYTDLMILPGYRFKLVDAMITNFHLPRSTLLMLVSAFAGRDFILEAYDCAVKEQYRFYSYGDAMFIQ